MIILNPTQTPAEAAAELSAIREAGKYILASPARTRDFLKRLGFAAPLKGASNVKRRERPPQKATRHA